jgi:hypothetical protein
MKVYKFELTFTEDELSGDEFWEDALNQDSTGIHPLTEAIVTSIEESNLVSSAVNNVKLISYVDNGK